MDTNLRSFRHAISVLKKQGLIPKRADTSVKIDARSVIPSMKVKGKRLDTLVKKFDDIVSGKATALSVPKKELPKFRRAGFQTARGKLIVPHAATEKVRIVGGQVTVKNPKGIERIQIPVPFQNLKQYLRDIKKNANTINALKGKREYFGIRFMGGQRANFYADIRDLIRDLERYESVVSARTRYKQQEIYKHLEIMRMNRAGALEVEKQVEKYKRKSSKAYNRKHSKLYHEKIKRNPQMLAKYNAAQAARQREYRERVKANPKKAAHERNMNRKRQKRNRPKP